MWYFDLESTIIHTTTPMLLGVIAKKIFNLDSTPNEITCEVIDMDFWEVLVQITFATISPNVFLAWTVFWRQQTNLKY